MGRAAWVQRHVQRPQHRPARRPSFSFSDGSAPKTVPRPPPVLDGLPRMILSEVPHDVAETQIVESSRPADHLRACFGSSSLEPSRRGCRSRLLIRRFRPAFPTSSLPVLAPHDTHATGLAEGARRSSFSSRKDPSLSTQGTPLPEAARESAARAAVRRRRGWGGVRLSRGALIAAARIVDAVGPRRTDAAPPSTRACSVETRSRAATCALSSASDSPVPKCDGCASPALRVLEVGGLIQVAGRAVVVVLVGVVGARATRARGRLGGEGHRLLGCGSVAWLSRICPVSVMGLPRRPRGCQPQDGLVTCPSRPSSRVLRDLLSGQGTGCPRCSSKPAKC